MKLRWIEKSISPLPSCIYFFFYLLPVLNPEATVISLKQKVDNVTLLPR